MIKKTLLLAPLLLSGIALEQNYTFVFSSVKNVSNANYFIDKYLKDRNDVKVVEYKGLYRVVYGHFTSRDEAHTFKQNLPQNLKDLKPFIISLDDDALENKVIDTTIPKAEEKKSEVKIIQNDTNVEKVKPMKNDDLKFGLTLEYSLQKNSENFTYGSNEKIDTDSLGLDEKTDAYTPTIYLKKGNHKVYGSYFYSDNDFSKTNTNSLNFDGTIFSANSNLEITDETKWLTVGYRYLFDEVSLGFDIHSYETQTSYKSSTTNATVKQDQVFPSLSIDYNNIDLSPILFSGGLSYGVKSSDLNYYYYYVGVGLNDFVFRDLKINVGYKNKTIDIKDGKYDGDKEYSGVFVNLNREF